MRTVGGPPTTINRSAANGDPVEEADTIAAIATASGGALRGVVRMSGPSVAACLKRCFAADDGGAIERLGRAAVVPGRVKVEPPVGELPCDLYLWPTARSYTRQPAAEIHTFGAPPLLRAVLHAVCSAGARLAEPGEFTLRAFLAGRLDLTQAEAVLGVIDARSRKELDVALARLAGGLSSPLNAMREELLDLLARVEAGLDFAEEEIEFVGEDELERRLAAAAARMEQLTRRITARTRLNDQVRVVLVGWPNTGKSSLLNALAGSPAALVSATPGTTRDYITRPATCDGLPCLLIDTPGTETNPIPSELGHAAQQMTRQQSRLAHLRLLCLDATRPLNPWEREQLEQPGEDQLLVLTKVDAGRTARLDRPAIETSSRTGQGLSTLRSAIANQGIQGACQEGDATAGAAARCRESLQLALAALERARQLAAARSGDELAASELRAALDELGKIVGAVYTEDLLDRIFSRFCIGK